ncbi:MAG: hypothetical protein ACXW05_13985 [Gemmatirosa sp.]
MTSVEAARAASALTVLGLVTVLATLSTFVRTLRTPVVPATRLPAPWVLLLPLVVLALLAAARRVSPPEAVRSAAVRAQLPRPSILSPRNGPGAHPL